MKMTLSLRQSSMWGLICHAVDRSRVPWIPRDGLTPRRPSPLSTQDCADPCRRVHRDCFYLPPGPVRPSRWEIVDVAANVVVEQLAFPSAVPFGIPQNDQVTVRGYHPAEGRPAWSLLVLHGIWRRDARFEDRLCRALAQQGVSCALMSLPFHWERTIPDAPSGAYFLSADPLWTAAAFRQAIVDARGVLGLLRRRGLPLGVMGFSLGGILAHVLMGIEPLDLGVSVVAGGDTAGIVWESPVTRPYRQAMEARGVTRARLSQLWAPGNPTLHARRARPPRLLMLNARHDGVIPRRFTEELWQALGKPPLRWLPTGHATAFLCGGVIVREVLGAMGLPVAAPAEAAGRRLAPVPARSEATMAA